jgi:hypothetical protein
VQRRSRRAEFTPPRGPNGGVNPTLQSCHVAALYDDEANAILNLDGTNESTIYMTAVGA